MGRYTWDNNTETSVKDEFGEERRAEDGGMFIGIDRWNAGLDTTEMFADLPGGACQKAHWGFVRSGSVTMRYTDGTSETLRAGDAYYMPPGHNAHVDEDVELVQFTKADATPDSNTIEG